MSYAKRDEDSGNNTSKLKMNKRRLKPHHRRSEHFFTDKQVNCTSRSSRFQRLTYQRQKMSTFTHKDYLFAFLGRAL